jgi:hypothetical protein
MATEIRYVNKSYKYETAIKYASAIKEIAINLVKSDNDYSDNESKEFITFVEGIDDNHWANYFINGTHAIRDDASDALSAAWDAFESGDIEDLYPIN